MGTILVTLFDSLWWSQDEGGTFILMLLDLSVASTTINLGVLLHQKWETSFCGGSSFSVFGFVSVRVPYTGCHRA